MMTGRNWKLSITLLAGLSTRSWAGGFEFPANGAEALGRGGAFTAKADTPLALEYNVAGLARQRGTRLLLDANIIFHTYEFQRAGTYPVTSNPNDPYLTDANGKSFAGQPYPLVRNQKKVSGAPFVGITTDFNRFDRWTFSIGLFTPTSVSNRTFSDNLSGPADGLIDGKPSPARYDLVQANLLVTYPTLAAAVRVTKWLDLGLALHVVVGKFETWTQSVSDLGTGLCPAHEYPGCDAKTQIEAVGATATVGIGALFRPLPQLSIGLNLRPPAQINAQGTLTATAPPVSTILPPPAEIQFITRFPTVLRFGIRYALMRQGFELADLEFNVLYENWAWAQGEGLKIASSTNENLGPTLPLGPIDNPIVSAHRYHDTYSLRLGGAYNLPVRKGVVTFRMGGFYDSPATDYKDTRLDFSTQEKYGIATGLAYKIRGITINLAFAHLYSPTREVTDGQFRPINGLHGTNNFSSRDTDGIPGQDPFPPVNNGFYRTHTSILSLGILFEFDELMRKKRVVKYN